MELYITDKGDPSVGIMQTGWKVECPFDNKADDEEQEYFRKQMIKLYSEFSEGRIIAEYDYEAKYKDEEHD